jgi:hypothetical protein
MRREKVSRACCSWPLAVLIAAALVGGCNSRVQSGAGCDHYTERNYRIDFEWDDGHSTVHAIDTRTGAEESSPQLSAAILREARIEVEKLASRTQLRTGKGHASVSLRGCSEPYLVTWSNPEIPELSELMGSAASWDLQKLKTLVNSGVNVNARGVGGLTPLMWAATDPSRKLSHSDFAKLTPRPDSRTVDFLLQHGADPNAKDDENLTVLMHADGSTASKIIAAKADFNARDANGLTALMHHALNGDTEAIRADVAGHADVNAVDGRGWSALMYAVNQGSVEAVQSLLTAGANRVAKNHEGQTALDIARKRAEHDPDFRRAVKLLLENHRTPRTPRGPAVGNT